MYDAYAGIDLAQLRYDGIQLRDAPQCGATPITPHRWLTVKAHMPTAPIDADALVRDRQVVPKWHGPSGRIEAEQHGISPRSHSVSRLGPDAAQMTWINARGGNPAQFFLAFESGCPSKGGNVCAPVSRVERMLKK